MSRRSGKVIYPSFYGRNVAKHAEKRYLRDQKTKEERLNDLRVSVASIMGHYTLSALRQQFGATEEQAQEVYRIEETTALWFKEMQQINGREMAMATLAGLVEDVQPDSFWIPEVKGKTLDELNAMKEAAELTARVYCKAIKEVFGFGKEDMQKVFTTAKQLYKDSIDADEQKDSETDGEEAGV